MVSGPQGVPKLTDKPTRDIAVKKGSTCRIPVPFRRGMDPRISPLVSGCNDGQPHYHSGNWICIEAGCKNRAVEVE
ncbi:unnamed protein product [Nezara viridula]|uniref:Uncharacterized protein n=1 Tax=Nezara viridula TaxID=85310 RepID=A0A9P0MEB3_NEZVI|nr:unnamed protein product [Nezara viridula]